MRVLLLTLLLVGCASTTQITTRFQSQEAIDPQPTLLLVAQTPETVTRETWELTCRKVFSSDQLTVLLSHQEVPLWYESGKKRILRWAQDNDIDRILAVNLTQMLVDSVPAQSRNRLNPMNQEAGAGQPTWEMGLGGELASQETSDPLREHDAELIDARGKPLWNGVAHTHEANDRAAIAKSQCIALRKILHELAFIP